MKVKILIFNLIIKTVSIWLAILVMAILNGGIRETFLIPIVGETYGLVASAIFLILIILLVSYFSIMWLGKHTQVTYILIGSCWFSLTVLFEFGFGYFILQKPLDTLLSAYLFKGGNLWPIVLLVIAIAPITVAKIRHLV